MRRLSLEDTWVSVNDCDRGNVTAEHVNGFFSGPGGRDCGVCRFLGLWCIWVSGFVVYVDLGLWVCGVCCILMLYSDLGLWGFGFMAYLVAEIQSELAYEMTH